MYLKDQSLYVSGLVNMASSVSKTINFSEKKINFLFYVPIEHKKYVSFGFRNITNDILGELQIYNAYNYQLIHRVPPIDYFQFFFKTEKNYDYLINLTLTSTSQNNDINKNFFYFLQIDNNDSIISLEKNKKHFIELIIDRLIIKENIRSRLYEAIELACKKANGIWTWTSLQSCEGSGLLQECDGDAPG